MEKKGGKVRCGLFSNISLLLGLFLELLWHFLVTPKRISEFTPKNASEHIFPMKFNLNVSFRDRYAGNWIEEE